MDVSNLNIMTTVEFELLGTAEYRRTRGRWFLGYSLATLCLPPAGPEPEFLIISYFWRKPEPGLDKDMT
jgi:hypothetical protein